MTNEEAKMTLVATQAMIGITVINDTNTGTSTDAMVNFSKRLSEAVTIACDAIDAINDKEIEIDKKGDKDNG